MTLIELCVVIMVIGILLVTAVAGLARARVVSNETAAIGALRTINSAQFAYASGCGGGNYATSLLILGTKAGNRQGYLAEDLGGSATPQRNGYRFNIRPGAGASGAPLDCNKVPTETAYYVVAIPAALGASGSRSFATGQNNAIWQAQGGVPPSEPFGPPAQLAR
jgi:type II secretory pathway pseudopilin PulG